MTPIEDGNEAPQLAYLEGWGRLLARLDNMPVEADGPRYVAGWLQRLTHAYVARIMRDFAEMLDAETLLAFFQNQAEERFPLPLPAMVGGDAWGKVTRAIVAGGIVRALAELRHDNLAFAVLPEIVETNAYDLDFQAGESLIRQLDAVPF